MTGEEDKVFDGLKAAALRGVEGAGARLGLYALENRREEDALPVLEDMSAKSQGDATLLHVVGLLHRAVGDLALAIKWLDRALLVVPDSARLVHARARSALEGGMPSVEWFRRALSIMPNDAEIILGLAAALVAENQVDAADDLLMSNLKKHPGWIGGHTVLIQTRYAHDRAGTALDQLDRAIGAAPRDYRLHNVKLAALHRAAQGMRALEALSFARQSGADPVHMQVMTAIIESEYAPRTVADHAFSDFDPFLDANSAVHWMRQRLRRGQADEEIGRAHV